MKAVAMRVLIGVQKHFRTRAPEWVVAWGLVAEGGYMLGPQDTLGSTRAYAFLARLASETTWGSIELALGITWLIALTLNGTFLSFRRVSPWVRACVAGTAATYLTVFATGMKVGNPIGTGFINHAELAALALVLCALIASEVADADKEAKRCRDRRRLKP